MGVNKVEYNGETLVDLTNDTVTPDTLAEGETAHDASGEPIVGRMLRQVEWDNVFNKPFTRMGSGTLTDDGSTEGKAVANNTWYKVCDQTPTIANFANGATLDLGFAQSEVVCNRLDPGVNELVAFDTVFGYVVYDANLTTYPENGIYYNYELVGGTTTQLTINGYVGFNVADVLNVESLPKHSHNDDTVTTTGTGSAYEGTVPGITALKSGVNFVMIPHVQSDTTQPSLNVNGLGVKRIYRRGSDLASFHGGYSNGWLRAGQAYRVMYNGSYWIVTDCIRPSADDLDGRVPVKNGGVPTVGVSNDGKVLTIEGDTYVWKEPSGGGSTTSGMPQIRFTSAIYTAPSKFVDAFNPLKLTVEIVGGGALQVGDQLQICVKRTYGYKTADFMSYSKQKLRQVCTCDITEEDLDKRFLTITTDGSIDKWLFKNDRNSTIGGGGEIDTLSAFYLRIRRPIYKETGDGYVPVDANFSNIVTVWKTYNLATGEVSIK